MLVDSSDFRDWIEPFNYSMIYRDRTYVGSRGGGYTVCMSPRILVPSRKTLKDYSYVSYFKDDFSKFTTPFDIPEDGYFMLHQGQRVIVETEETLKLPLSGVALVAYSIPRLALLGLSITSSVIFPDEIDTRVDNSKVTKLKLAVKNDSDRNIQLIRGMPIAVILFQKYETVKIPYGFDKYDYTA